uniref:Uncharacterized protein n=1 Tax=Oryza barthii TaxID=65489 RepID=A0A0D3HIZ1_9ORYZ
MVSRRLAWRCARLSIALHAAAARRRSWRCFCNNGTALDQQQGIVKSLINSKPQTESVVFERR